MANVTLVYPLADVMVVKEQRVKAAEKELALRRKELEQEQERLKEAEAKRDEVKQHMIDKLTQMRDAFDHGTNSEEIRIMKVYLAVVKERLAGEEEKVKKQEEAVELAEKNVELALLELQRKRTEVDKLVEHRKMWLKVAKRELEAEQAKELDEIGSILFLANKNKWK